MPRTTLISVVVSIFFLTTQTAVAAGVDLAKLSGWDIVVPADALPSEAYAAEEFRSIFAQATGIDLPVVASPDRADRHVLIGPSKSLAESFPGFDLAAMGPEDLRILVQDNLIAIAGGRPRGTLYGVYTFLEDYLGVRFLTADHTHIPKLTETFVIGPLDRSYSPPLSFRWSYYGETNRSPMLAARLRVNTVGGDAKYGGKIRPVAHQPYVWQPDTDGQIRGGTPRVFRAAQRQASGRRLQ